jgi:hypothetical protein
MLQLDVLEFANQLRKLDLSKEQMVGIANALAACENAPKGEPSKAHLFPAAIYRFMVLGEFDEQARKAPDPVGSSCQSSFTHWRDQLAKAPAKPKSPKS